MAACKEEIRAGRSPGGCGIRSMDPDASTGVVRICLQLFEDCFVSTHTRPATNISAFRATSKMSSTGNMTKRKRSSTSSDGLPEQCMQDATGPTTPPPPKRHHDRGYSDYFDTSEAYNVPHPYTVEAKRLFPRLDWGRCTASEAEDQAAWLVRSFGTQLPVEYELVGSLPARPSNIRAVSPEVDKTPESERAGRAVASSLASRPQIANDEDETHMPSSPPTRSSDAQGGRTSAVPARDASLSPNRLYANDMVHAPEVVVSGDDVIEEDFNPDASSPWLLDSTQYTQAIPSSDILPPSSESSGIMTVTQWIREDPSRRAL